MDDTTLETHILNSCFSMDVFHVFWIVKMIPNRETHYICSTKKIRKISNFCVVTVFSHILWYFLQHPSMTFSEDFHLFYFNHCFHLKFLTGHLHKQSGHENLATSVAKVGQTPKAEFFAKKISGFQPLTIFAKKLFTGLVNHLWRQSGIFITSSLSIISTFLKCLLFFRSAFSTMPSIHDKAFLLK